MFFPPPHRLGFVVLFVSILLLFQATATLSSVTTRLPDDEVKALREIGARMGKTNWNFDVDPCSRDSGWITQNPPKDFPNPPRDFANNVSCDCSFSNFTVCHIVSIVLKAQSLPGTVPPEMVKLPYLQQM